MASFKRRHEVVDLTGDDSGDERYSKTPRSSFYSSPHQGRPSQNYTSSSEQGVDLMGDDVDRANGNEIMYMTQADQIDLSETYEHYGTTPTKVVGLRYYRGIARKGESVQLRREPHNQYDPNAIRVLNVQGEQIGHVPRQVAAKLASYMDRHELDLEARLSDWPGEYDVAMNIKLYGPSDPEERNRLREKLQRDRLDTSEFKRREEVEKARQREELKKAAQAQRQAQKAKKNAEQWMNGMNSQGNGDDLQEPEESIEDIMSESRVVNPREMGQVAEKFGAQEEDMAKMPEAEQPTRISTKMLPYQRQALAWLLEKEDPHFAPTDSDETSQLWKVKRQSSNITYTNIATNFTTRQKPDLARGGILADDMGLGKTLEMISLMVADKERFGEQGPTLIIAPLSVMSNWSQQIERHVDPDNTLTIHTYHGSNRGSMKPSDFKKYDVVITTYGTLAVEYLPKGTKNAPRIPRANGLYSLTWRRIIIDEGHNIRNPNTKSALAVCAVQAYAKWALTGTPIVNSLKDLYSLIRFIGLTGGLEKFELFNSLLIRPMREGLPESQLLLQALMATFCLRRRKDMAFVDLKLPELTEYVHRIKWSKSEREKYSALRDEARGTLNTYQAEDGRNAQNAYRHLLEVLLRLRQVCNHWKLCEERVSSLMELLEKQKTVDLTPENRRILQGVLQLSIEQHEECPICLETLHNPVITHCGHIFGNECITRVIEGQHRCPMCRADLVDETKLVPPAVEFGDDAPEEDIEDEGDSSAKVQALLKVVAASHKKSKGKIVIFSQWRRFLDLLQPQLDDRGYGVTRLDGTMSATKRDTSLRAFDNDEEVTILLATLGVCAVGLNLVVADTVILCDSWWAPAIEDQAVDRVHRLGQKRRTTVWRLVMEDSVEERTLEIQKDKRDLMAMALKESPEEKKRREGGRSRTLGDIQKLLEGS